VGCVRDFLQLRHPVLGVVVALGALGAVVAGVLDHVLYPRHQPHTPAGGTGVGVAFHPAVPSRDGQTVEKKARFIAQLKTGNIDTRTAEDVGGGMENAAAATKAVSTGDPRYVEQVQLADDVARLAAMQRAHSDSKGRNAADRRMLGQDVVAAGRQLSALDAVLPALEASKEAPFAMLIRGRTFTERAQAAPTLAQSLRQAYTDGRGKGAQAVFVVASLRGWT